MSRARFELFEDQAGETRFRLRAGNGEVVAQSEGYGDEHKARRGIRDMVTATLFTVGQPIGLAREPRTIRVDEQ